MNSEQLVKERIVKDLAEHTITVKHAHGMYRHWRCQKLGSWHLGFDIITWPGSLCYTGDMGDYLFQRTEDTVDFMSRVCNDYRYAAEKCVAKSDTIKEWREEIFLKALTERAKSSKKFQVMRQGSYRTESVAEKVAEIRRAYDEYSIPSDATKAMYESGLWDGCDLPNCEQYTLHFLWCLHAIKWFCDHVAK